MTLATLTKKPNTTATLVPKKGNLLAGMLLHRRLLSGVDAHALNDRGLQHPGTIPDAGPRFVLQKGVEFAVISPHSN